MLAFLAIELGGLLSEWLVRARNDAITTTMATNLKEQSFKVSVVNLQLAKHADKASKHGAADGLATPFTGDEIQQPVHDFAQ